MQFDMQVEGSNNGGSQEQASSSDDGQFLVALRKIMKKEIEVMVIHAVREVILPTIGGLIRKVVELHRHNFLESCSCYGDLVVFQNLYELIGYNSYFRLQMLRTLNVKEEIQEVEKRLLMGGSRNSANEMTMLKERNLQLKFSDEVSAPVLTGKVLKGKGGNSIEVSLVDRTTGQVVNCGPESSAKVEILVLDASGDDNGDNWTLENFNNRIIKEGDKEKPHFAKSIYIHLKEGSGVLSKAKLGHDKGWTKSCKCRLGARIVQNFRGINVQEAKTESFEVADSRSKIYEKHYPPSLSDEVWRLEKIGRGGAPCMRLNNENILTVQDFLFLLSVDPQTLKDIVYVADKNWNTTVKHARTCIIDDKKLYLCYPSTESEMGVIFDAVGGLKGAIIESHYVMINELSVAEKDHAHKLLLIAFKNRKERTSFDDEASLLQRHPYRSNDIIASTSTSSQEGANGGDLFLPESTVDYNPTEPGTSRSIRTSDHPNSVNQFAYLESTDTGQTDNSIFGLPTQSPSCYFPELENLQVYDSTDPGTSPQSIIPPIRTFDYPENIFPNFQISCSDCLGELSDDLMSLINRETNNISESSESHFHEQSNARFYLWPLVGMIRWVSRAKKKVTDLGGIHVQKKQRI